MTVNLDDLIDLVRHGEGLTLDFKQELPSNGTKIGEVLSSFANCEGGILIVGVADDGEFIGIREPDPILQRLASISQSTCRPPLATPRMGAVPLGVDRYIAWIEVSPVESGLCFVEGKCYIRVGPTSMPVTSYEQIQAVLRQQDNNREQRARRSLPQIIGLRFADPGSSFKDREEKIAALRDFVLGETAAKLILIPGRAGIGKTALLSKLCSELEAPSEKPIDSDRQRVDAILYYCCLGTDIPLIGRLFSDFARILDKNLAQDLAECWQDKSQSRSDKIRLLLSNLRSGRYLLVLDNLEVLLDNDGLFLRPDMADFFEITLTTNHSLQILATTRRKPTLGCGALRAIRNIPLDSGLPDEAAIELLREMDAIGGSIFAQESDEVVLQIARKCYGIPRALEAFVGILISDTALTASTLLANAALFETHVAENLVADHHNRLSEHERRVVEVLAVLNRPVRSEAVGQILNSISLKLDLEQVLSRLIRQYAISHHREGGTYYLHPLDQAHAYARIPPVAPGYNLKLLHNRAAEYYSGTALSPESKYQNLADLDPLLTAFLHLRCAGEGDSACLLLNRLDPEPLSLWGHYQLIAELRESIIGLQSSSLLQAVNLGRLGQAHANLGNTERAMQYFAQSRDCARDAHDVSEIALRSGNLGEVCFVLGETDKALLHFQEAYDEFLALGDSKEAGFWRGHIGLAHSRLGNLVDAEECFVFAVQAAAMTGDPREGSWLSNLGALLLLKGDAIGALDYYTRSIEMARVIQDRRGLVARIRGAGNCHMALRRFTEAAHDYEEALEIARTIKSRYGTAATLHCLGRLQCNLRDFERSRSYLQESISLHSPSTEYQSWNLLGIVDLLDGRAQDAETSFKSALCLCSDRLVKTPNDFDALYGRGIACVGLSDYPAAQTDFSAALQICTAPGVILDVQSDLALLRSGNRDPDVVTPFIEVLGKHELNIRNQAEAGNSNPLAL